MKRINLQENEGVELVFGKLRLYVSLVDAEDERFSHGFQIIADKPIHIKPRSGNAIMVIPEPYSRIQDVKS